jgi:integrase
MIYKQPKSKYWWYKFTWNGELIRESTKQTNKRVAEQIAAAHKTALAKGEVGIRERKRSPTLAEFAEWDFLPFVKSTFEAKPKTLEYYRNGTNNLLAYAPLAKLPLESITAEKVTGYVAKRIEAGREVTTINRELEVLRRMLKLAVEWGKVEKLLPRVSMLPGERHRERVLTPDELARYFAATMSAEMKHHAEPQRLHHATAILDDCALRPEECCRLRWENIRDGSLHVFHGKSENARRIIPMTPRAAAIMEMRRATAKSEWVFPAPTKSGHIEKSTLKKQHQRACQTSGVEKFELYVLRHTCLTRWAKVMDPYTLAYLAGHSDFATTKRYVHPQPDTVREAMERAQVARSGHTSGHTYEKAAESLVPSTAAIQ